MADARTFLRDGTQAEHDRVDALLGAFDLSARAGYARFLAVQARAYLPVEAALNAGGIADLVPGWTPRGPALESDLAALGLAPAPAAPPILADTPSRLGAWYVLEGSRLGGRLLHAQVGPGLPTAFLSAPGQRWAKSVELLNECLYLESDLFRALAAARATFLLFERAAMDLD